MILKQKCPRCGTKHMEQELQCDQCGLIFERLNYATNKDAKKAIKEGKANQVVYIKNTPSDVKRYKLVLFAIFLGFFGAHCFYVGRYKKACVMLVMGLISVVAGILAITKMTPIEIQTLLLLITASQTFMWLFDVVDVCIFKFKIPVYLINKK